MGGFRLPGCKTWGGAGCMPYRHQSLPTTPLPSPLPLSHPPILLNLTFSSMNKGIFFAGPSHKLFFHLLICDPPPPALLAVDTCSVSEGVCYPGGDMAKYVAGDWGVGSVVLEICKLHGWTVCFHPCATSCLLSRLHRYPEGTPTASAQACCAVCDSLVSDGCLSWTFRASTGVCWLKSTSTLTPSQDPDCTSSASAPEYPVWPLKNMTAVRRGRGWSWALLTGSRSVPSYVVGCPISALLFGGCWS